MYSRTICLLVLCAVGLGSANTLQGTVDVKRLQAVFQEGLKNNDLASIYYSVKGLKDLKVSVPDICGEIKKVKNYDDLSIEQIFYLTNAASLSGCQNFLGPEILKPPTQTLDKKDPTLQEMYYAIYSLKALGRGEIYSREEGLKNLIQILKKDDTPANYGYVFLLCEHMGCEKWTVAHAEGVLLAADESDARALHFDGGLPVTAMLLAAIRRAYASQKKPSPLSEEQRGKFAAYALSRRSVTSPRGASLLLDLATAIADDQPTPISIVIKGKKYVTSESDSIEFSITDLVGRALPALGADEVVAQSGTRLADDVVVLSKQPLAQKPGDPTTFVLNLAKIKAQYGLYKIALSAGGKTANVNIAVLGEIQVASVEVGVGDVDGTTSPKVTTVAYPNKLTEKLQADHLQKVTLKFTVRDKWNKPVVVQQAFVRVGGARGQETIFVAEPDSAKTYKVDLNVGALAKHLGHESGAYSLSVMLGDSAAAAPVLWPLGDVQLNLAASRHAPARDESRARGGARGGPLPELAHEFRSAEARPARALSDVFALAAGAPLLLLLAAWLRLGLNLGNFPFTVSALVFHLSLGASLGLYGVLWLQLTMFETMRYLLPLAALTFLSGHRLLRRLADKPQR